MRYIRPSQFQLRLGWLSVMAVHLGYPRLARLDRSALGQALLKSAMDRHGHGESQSHWLATAGLLASPQGRMSPRAESDIARMGEIYGIYDPTSQTLTDLGQVLLAVEPWRLTGSAASPFSWTSGKRFVGLRLLIGANGDLILALLRRFPESGIQRGRAIHVLTECIDELIGRSVGDEERADLTRYAERMRLAAQEQDRDLERARNLRVQLVIPQFESLRDLRYIKPGAHAGDYELTDDGLRLKTALARVTSADELLAEGLSRAFLLGEGVSPIDTASGTDVMAVLSDLPEHLHAAAAEAPLEPVVLLSQCRLLDTSPGRWIDIVAAKSLISALEQRTRGRIGLNQITSGGNYNIVWTSPSVLTQHALWSNSEVAGSIGAETPTGNNDEKPAELEDKRMLDAHRQDLLSAFLVRVQQCTPPPLALHLRLWLKFLSELLEMPAPGGIASTSFGGPRGWTDTLIYYLDHPLLGKKRAPLEGLLANGRPEDKVLVLAPLNAWLKQIGPLALTLPIRRSLVCWADAQKTSPSVLRGQLLWAKAALVSLENGLAGIVRQFLRMPTDTVQWDEWEKVRGATQALVEDAVHRGYWRRDELSALLQGRLRLVANDEMNLLEVACGVLDDLVCVPDEEDFTFEQEFQVPQWLGQTLIALSEEQRRLSFNSAQVELSSTKPASNTEDAPSEITMIAATVMLRARTPVQAWARGEEYAHDALSRLRFLALLRCAGNLPSSTDERRIDPRTIRFSRGDGSRWELSRVGEDTSVAFAKPDFFGFVRVANRPNECPVQGLPGLAAVDRGTLLDGQARLTRALHWLSIAEDRGERPGERLSHAWVALEHLVTDGGESKLPVVIESVPGVIALCHLRATFGAVFREALSALHCLACEHSKERDVANLIDAWLGTEALQWYLSRPAVVGRYVKERKVDDAEGLKTLILRRSQIPDLARMLEKHAPYASYRLRLIEHMLSKSGNLREVLLQTRVDAACLLSQVYDVRNQLVHDANPFGFDDAYRLHVLYDRYRALIDPVVGEVLRLVVTQAGWPLSHAWSLMNARFDELVDPTCKSESAVDGNRLIECLV